MTSEFDDPSAVYKHQIAILEKQNRELQTDLQTAQAHVAALGQTVLDLLTDNDRTERRLQSEIDRLKDTWVNPEDRKPR